MSRPTPQPTAEERPGWLEFGARALDRVTGAEGTVTGLGEPFELGEEAPVVAYLRPVAGGFEWKAQITDLTPAPHGRTQ